MQFEKGETAKALIIVSFKLPYYLNFHLSYNNWDSKFITGGRSERLAKNSRIII